jgi:hypothetical protein
MLILSSMNSTQEASSPETTPERLEELSKESAALSRLVARNPSTPQRLLKEFASSADEMLCFAVAQNPSAPKPTLFKLGERFPRALIQNPVLSLFLLEDAGLLQWPDKTLLALLSLRELAPEFLEMMSGARSFVVRQRVAMHENLAPHTLHQLLRDDVREVHEAAAKHHSLPAALRELFKKASASSWNNSEHQFLHKLSTEEMTTLWQYGTYGQSLVKKRAELTPTLLAQLEQEQSNI